MTFLFVVAQPRRRRVTAHGPGRPRPFINALSLAIYCTSWTFFGSVGLSSERGPEFLGLYIGPVLVFVFGFPLLARIVRLAKTEKITSVADFLGARYGKSFTVAAIATLIATIGAVPYMALQLKAISGSVSLMVAHYTGAPPSFDPFVSDISLIVAMLLALFSVLFGTRHADATEHQDGLVLAVAVESVVKLAAFPGHRPAGDLRHLRRSGRDDRPLAADTRVREAMSYGTSLATWLVLTGLSGFAILMLPRSSTSPSWEPQRSELRTAAWVFPAYLIAINLFVLPIALAGLAIVPAAPAAISTCGAAAVHRPRLLAIIAFVGGFSAATAMVIVESVALSIMTPTTSSSRSSCAGWCALKFENENGPPSSSTCGARRSSSCCSSPSSTIAPARQRAPFLHRLMSFAAMPSSRRRDRRLIWRGANGKGAALGMAAGISVWAYTLLFPSLAAADNAIVVNGLFGLEALRPQQLFGTVAEPLNHWRDVEPFGQRAVLLLRLAVARLAAAGAHTGRHLRAAHEAGPMPSLRRFRTTTTVNAMKDTISRYLGVERTERSFQSFEATNGTALHGYEQASMEVIRFSEQLWPAPSAPPRRG